LVVSFLAAPPAAGTSKTSAFVLVASTASVIAMNAIARLSGENARGCGPSRSRGGTS
jgi:hypothetical protein